MWNYRKLSSNDSPMAEIISRCSCKSNIRLVVYHLSENHVECATDPHVDQFSLGNTARTIMADSRHNHAVLAYDLGTNEVYKIEDVPELPIASAVLLCVVTELLNGCVQPRDNQYGAPVAAQNRSQMSRVSAPRASNGQFVKQESCHFKEEVKKQPSAPTRVISEGTPLVGHRFRLGRH